MGLRIGSGRMVMQAAADFLVGGSNPGAGSMAAAPPPASMTRNRTGDLKYCGPVRYHSIRGAFDVRVSPIARSLLSENF